LYLYQWLKCKILKLNITSKIYENCHKVSKVRVNFTSFFYLYFTFGFRHFPCGCWCCQLLCLGLAFQLSSCRKYNGNGNTNNDGNNRKAQRQFVTPRISRPPHTDTRILGYTHTQTNTLHFRFTCFFFRPKPEFLTHSSLSLLQSIDTYIYIYIYMYENIWECAWGKWNYFRICKISASDKNLLSFDSVKALPKK